MSGYPPVYLPWLLPKWERTEIVTFFLLFFFFCYCSVAKSCPTFCNPMDSSFSSKEQVSFNFMAAVTICSDFGAQENKVCHCSHFSPIYLLWNDGTGWHDLNFLNVEFQASFFTIIKRFFSSFSLSAIRMLTFAYLRLSIFLLVILEKEMATHSNILAWKILWTEEPGRL